MILNWMFCTDTIGQNGSRNSWKIVDANDINYTHLDVWCTCNRDTSVYDKYLSNQSIAIVFMSKSPLHRFEY